MKFRILALACGLLLSTNSLAEYGPGDQWEDQDPNHGDFQMDVFSMGRNSAEGRLTMSIGSDQYGGLGVVVDRLSDRVFLSGNGQSVSYSIPDMAQMFAPNDASLRSDFISTVRGGFGNMDGMIELQGRSEPWIRENGGPNLGGACDMSPCRSSWGNGYGSNYTWGAYIDPNNPDLSGWSEETLRYDRMQFDNAKQEHCSNENKQAIKLVLMGIGTGASCLAAETGLGAIGCGAGVASIAFESSDNGSTRLCHKNYPGPGKWAK